MNVKCFTNGPFMVNTYLLYEKNGIIIDPGHDCSELTEFARNNDIEIHTILLTHGHIDHVEGVNFVRNEYPDVKVYMSRDDLDLLHSIKFQAKMFSLPAPEDVYVDYFIEDGQVLELEGMKILCIATPGHSVGSISFICGDIIFAGDVIFRESVGRTDLFGGNHSILINSIKEKIFTLFSEAKIYPGHGPETTVAYEMKYNQFLK